MKRFNYYTPSLGESWALVAVLLMGMLAVGLFFGLVWPSAPQTITYSLGMLVPVLFAYLLGSQRMKSGAGQVPVNHGDIGAMPLLYYIVLLFISLVAISILVEPATAFIPMPDKIKSVFEKAFLNAGTVDLVLSTCICAPLFEELICRGLIMRGIIANGGSARKAILWSAFFFAFVHLNPWQSIPAFALGAFFGWVYWRTGSLLSTIALHAVNNSISVIISKIWPEMAIDTGLIDILPTELYIVIYIASAALLFAAISLLNRKLPKNV